LNKEDIERLRELLLKERKRVMEELNWIESNYIGKSQKDAGGGSARYSMHPAELGTDSSEQEKAYMIGSASGRVLEDIDEALDNLDKQDFGICVSCGRPIGMDRLEVVPYARLCISCKARAEGSPGGTP
jgi:RNA polymerase-binding protein DksA